MVLLRPKRHQAARAPAPQTEIQASDVAKMKQAKLANGEILEFPDNTPESVVRRAVRNHLNIDSADVMAEAMDKMSARLDKITEKMAENHKQATSDMADAVSMSVSRLAGELADGIREIQKTVKALHEPMYHANMIANHMSMAVTGLNKTLDAAMGQTLDAADRGREIMQGGTTSMERHAQLMAQSMERLAGMIESMSQMKKTKRTARRNRDGSYTFE
jgi:hypothetical protein